MDILTLFKKYDLELLSVSFESFGSIYRANNLKALELLRQDLINSGHKTPISCHREEGSIESFMVIWNK